MKPNIVSLAIQIMELKFELEKATSEAHELDLTTKIKELEETLRDHQRSLRSGIPRAVGHGNDQYAFYNALRNDKIAKYSEE